MMRICDKCGQKLNQGAADPAVIYWAGNVDATYSEAARIHGGSSSGLSVKVSGILKKHGLRAGSPLDAKIKLAGVLNVPLDLTGGPFKRAEAYREAVKQWANDPNMTFGQLGRKINLSDEAAKRYVVRMTAYLRRRGSGQRPGYTRRELKKYIIDHISILDNLYDHLSWVSLPIHTIYAKNK